MQKIEKKIDIWDNISKQKNLIIIVFKLRL